MIARRSAAEIEKLDRAGRLVRTILKALTERAQEGVTTAELDRLAEKMALDGGARPAFKGYRGYPFSVCISVNEEVVHGMPGPRQLQAGDLVSLDFGVLLDGYYGDSAVTVGVGRMAEDDRKLSRVTRESLMLAIEQVKPGNHVCDLGHAVEVHAAANGFSVVREFVGHGIGTRMHEEPQIPNYGRPGQGPKLEEGMVLAIEPMVTAGSGTVRILPDGWTAVTRDGSRAAHWELAVAVTGNGALILGGPAEFPEE